MGFSPGEKQKVLKRIAGLEEKLEALEKRMVSRPLLEQLLLEREMAKQQAKKKGK